MCSEHREHTWKISMNRWICTEGDGYIIWGKGIHGEYVFAGGDVQCTVQSLMILYELMKMVPIK